MKLYRCMVWSALVLSLCLLYSPDHHGAHALEQKNKGVEKVKCKEQVDEALRQYWNKDGEGPSGDGQDSHEDGDQHGQDASTNEDDQDDEDARGHNHSPDDDDEHEDTNESNQSGEKDAQDDEDSDEKTEDTNDNQSKESSDEDGRDNDQDENDKDGDQEDEEETKIEPNEDNLKKENDKLKEETKEENDDEEEETVDEEELQKQQHEQRRSRVNVDDVLRVYEIGSQDDNLEQNLIQSIFRDLKRTYETTVKPLESIYKYRQISTRYITDAEIFSKPMVFFLGGKSTGKSSLVNYLLGIDDTPWQIKTGAASQTKFTILTYGDNYTHLSPTELSADFTFSSLQRFGEQFVTDYIDAHRLPINILQRMTIVDSPGLIDLQPTSPAKQVIDNDVYQWFIDRSDVLYIVIDVSQLYLSNSLRALLDQLKGREVRFILSKADMASHTQIVSMFGQLLWMLSPIMSAERPPQVYALSTMAQHNFDEFLDEQETGWLKDLSRQLGGIARIESHIAEVRRHAVRVRNHAKLIDCYLSTYYKNKGLFTFGDSSRRLAADISDNPHQYRIYTGAFMGQLQNVSRYDLPDPGVYREFFRSNPLIDFKPLTSTCSYFRGCPIDRLDVAIAYDLPELLGKYRKLTRSKVDQQ